MQDVDINKRHPKEPHRAPRETNTIRIEDRDTMAQRHRNTEAQSIGEVADLDL